MQQRLPGMRPLQPQPMRTRRSTGRPCGSHEVLSPFKITLIFDPISETAEELPDRFEILEVFIVHAGQVYRQLDLWHDGLKIGVVVSSPALIDVPLYGVNRIHYSVASLVRFEADMMVRAMEVL